MDSKRIGFYNIRLFFESFPKMENNELIFEIKKVLTEAHLA